MPLKYLNSSGVPDQVSYEYQFGTREVFDHAVLGSWPMDGTLFGADATSLAIEDGALMGIEIGMRGTEYKTRQHALAPLWKNLIERGDVSKQDFYGLLERADHASWLNPVYRRRHLLYPCDLQ